MYRIICICGFKRSGKDFVADQLVSQYSFHKISIADRLKKTVRILFNLNDDQLHGESKDVIDPLWNVTPRTLMDFMGTEVMQFEIQKILPKSNRSFWIDTIIPQITDQLKISNVVIPDLRFPHEIVELKKRFPLITIVRINNPSVVIDPTLVSERSSTDISCDYIIHNDFNDDPMVLQNEIRRVMNEN
jgi:hypothetical protein